jgi:hypothetical protein
MTEALPVLAVVVATRGGSRLEPVLASVSWARERAVLDPLGELSATALPASVRLGRDAGAIAALGSAPWVLLLAEDEVAGPAFRDAVARVAPQPPAARLVAFEVEMLGICFALRRPLVRLGARAHSRVALDRALELTLAGPPAPLARLDAVLRAERGATVAAAVDALVPESRVRAALLAQAGSRPGAASLVASPLAALGRVLRAQASRPAGLARWIAAVFAAYRVVLGHARWWEWRHAQPAPMREVA